VCATNEGGGKEKKGRRKGDPLSFVAPAFCLWAYRLRGRKKGEKGKKKKAGERRFNRDASSHCGSGRRCEKRKEEGRKEGVLVFSTVFCWQHRPGGKEKKKRKKKKRREREGSQYHDTVPSAEWVLTFDLIRKQEGEGKRLLDLLRVSRKKEKRKRGEEGGGSSEGWVNITLAVSGGEGGEREKGEKGGEVFVWDTPATLWASDQQGGEGKKEEKRERERVKALPDHTVFAAGPERGGEEKKEEGEGIFIICL